MRERANSVVRIRERGVVPGVHRESEGIMTREMIGEVMVAKEEVEIEIDMVIEIGIEIEIGTGEETEEEIATGAVE
jgi:hypothetical protein